MKMLNTYNIWSAMIKTLQLLISGKIQLIFYGKKLVNKNWFYRLKNTNKKYFNKKTLKRLNKRFIRKSIRISIF